MNKEQGITIKGMKDLTDDIPMILEPDVASSMAQGNMVYVESSKKSNPEGAINVGGEKKVEPVQAVKEPVVVQPVVEKPVIEKPVEVSAASKVDYKSVLKRTGLVSDLDDFEIEGDDGEMTPLSNVDLDEARFVELLKVFINEKEESLKTNMVSIDSLSEFSKRLIDLEKSGGDVAMILQNYADNQDSISRYDLNSMEGKLGFINEFYVSSGMSADDAKDLTNVIGSRGEDAVDAKVDSILSERDALINKSIEDEKKRAEDSRKQAEESHKKFRKGIRDGLKSEFQLNDKYIEKMVDSSTFIDKEGVLALGRKFTEVLNDPELSAGLILFLMDRDEYLKQKSAVIEKDLNTKVRKAIKLNNSKSMVSPRGEDSIDSTSGDGWTQVTSDVTLI